METDGHHLRMHLASDYKSSKEINSTKASATTFLFPFAGV